MCYESDCLVEALVNHYPEERLKEYIDRAGLGPCSSKLEMAMRVAELHYEEFSWDGRKHD